MTADAMLLPATPLHAAALAAIHAVCFPRAEQWGADAMALQLGLPGAFGFMHLGGGMVLARAVADEAEILTIAVTPDRRRSGLGTALMGVAMAGARERGAVSMFLEVAVTNVAARALYGRHGFVEVGHRPRYYPGGGDALVLRADLTLCP
jgi:ribosomal-protein-alanine N-acetyltransferase